LNCISPVRQKLERRKAMQINRRALVGAGLAGAAGLFGFAVPRVDAHTGTLTEEEFRRLAFKPQTPDDYRKLATHVRKLAGEAGAEAKLYDAIGAGYRKGVSGAKKAQSVDLARGIEHAAEHNRDSEEALLHLAEAFEGLAENFQKLPAGA
jgi:hypothetical protein